MLDCKWTWNIDGTDHEAYSQEDYDSFVQKDLAEYRKNFLSVSKKFPQALSGLFSLNEENIDKTVEEIRKHEYARMEAQ